ncbi:peptidase M15 [Rheinheimera sediminis]|uniref:M15 family metallopeptidase n=1 Tax=Rheinheimera sp. YQF-1 TaxID=2499626 RepID=UPI000FDB805B|nr:M15 family metallopeptidase [Rheinheimera sp. YQF-1]RVT44875.1 peptidase M15 [Rheinheimera sp. YQF-1]
MKIPALVTFSCFLLVSCVTTVQQKKTAPQAATDTAKTLDKIRVEPRQPADIINLLEVTNQLQIAMAFAGNNNFTGKTVPGYQANSCFLTKNTAEALALVAQKAQRLGYQLQLLDCYRPQRASNHLMLWSADTTDQSTKASFYPKLQKNQLSPTFITAYSDHSRASAVDLTLLQKNAAGQWQQLDMGGSYLLFDSISYSDSTAVNAQQKANRLLLKDLMQQQGFISYAREWWHFSLTAENYPTTYFDFPVQ